MKLEIVGRGGTLYKELGLTKEEFEGYKEESILTGAVTQE